MLSAEFVNLRHEWPKVVGAQINAVVSPIDVTPSGSLVLLVPDDTWRRELELYATEILRSLPPVVDGVRLRAVRCIDRTPSWRVTVRA